ncbi:tetratricopeptide repeat-containing sensor histidine kinase [Cyclobacterium sp.]|uniref:tetratricopeptide repeat-containing sensor histidine kinase n=1 Tax=Cyclobacterium sp. TaxID=1966343 RepID=UPI0019BD7757|nr:tetratricopeptide repeat-containing sensor histidine kinase [Cyclobacterium sp.]MBD3629652.1 tetratricopeptide repeat-containing sensor histidine kinase [Cyclobacterium sp.]
MKKFSRLTFFGCNTLFQGCIAVTILIVFVGCAEKEESYQPLSPKTSDILDKSSNLLNSGQFRNSLNFIDSAYRHIEDKGTLDLWEKYNFLSKIYLTYDIDLDKSKQYLDSMFWLLEDSRHIYEKEYAQTKFLEGDWYKAKKQFNSAFESYFEGREFAGQNLSNCLISNLTYQVGLFRYQQNKFEESLPYFRQAIRENEDCWGNGMLDQNLYFPQMYRNTLALSFEKMGLLDSAVVHYQKGINFLENAENKYPGEKHFISLAKGVYFGNLGGALAKLGQDKEAEKFLKRSIAINSRPEYDRRDAQTSKVKLIELLIRQSRLDEARTYLDQLDVELTEAEVKNRSYINTLIQLNRVKGEYFQKSGASDRAYHFLKDYYHLRDSIEKVDEELRLVDMEESYENAAQQYQLSIVNRDNHIKNIYLGAAVGFTVLLVVFLGLAWRGLKRSKNINRVISQQNIELQETLGALEQSQAENTKIMYMVAHDLRNPISSMVMMSDILLSDEQITGENRVLLEHIKTSCNNSLNLVSEMMQSNKNSAALTKEPVEIDRLLNYCVELLQHKAQEKDQKILLETIPVTASVSREKLWRVISNLIANAIKFSPKGKSIRVSMRKKFKKILILIKDEGIGIPEEIKNQVFEWYTEGKRHGTEGEKPFGMGMAISKQIITAHGGNIWFESEENKGTTFYVELPI